MNETIQYIIVGAILLASAIRIVVKFRRKRNGKDAGCCGCSLAETCNKNRSVASHTETNGVSCKRK